MDVDFSTLTLRFAEPLKTSYGDLRERSLLMLRLAASDGVIGLYNVATVPDHRERGFGEAITRHAFSQAVRKVGPKPAVLQSTSIVRLSMVPCGLFFRK